MPVADIFLCGLLRYLPVLKTVLGRSTDAVDLLPGDLDGHAVCWDGEQPFPTVLTEPGALARGLLFRGASDEDMARVAFFAGALGCIPAKVTARRACGEKVRATVFRRAQGGQFAAGIWSMDKWASGWGAINNAAADEIMAWYGRKSATQVNAILPGFYRRASARVAAQLGDPDPERDLSRDVCVKTHRHAYANFFAMQELDLQVRQYDGSMGPVMNRAAVLVGQAAVVLPYDPVRDCVMLVEQFRAPVFLVGDPAPWVWEPIAGLLEPGESAESAALREAEEEAGLAIRHLEPAGKMYSSTGSSTEYLHLFIGLADLSGDATGIGGTDEGEDIRSRILGFNDLMAGVDVGRYCDMPLVTAALWLARHRDRIRSKAG